MESFPVGISFSSRDELVLTFDYSSKLAAGVLGGLDKIFIQPGSKVLYLGAGMVYRIPRLLLGTDSLQLLVPVSLTLQTLSVLPEPFTLLNSPIALVVT